VRRVRQSRFRHPCHRPLSRASSSARSRIVPSHRKSYRRAHSEEEDEGTPEANRFPVISGPRSTSYGPSLAPPPAAAAPLFMLPTSYWGKSSTSSLAPASPRRTRLHLLLPGVRRADDAALFAGTLRPSKGPWGWLACSTFKNSGCACCARHSLASVATMRTARHELSRLLLSFTSAPKTCSRALTVALDSYWQTSWMATDGTGLKVIVPK